MKEFMGVRLPYLDSLAPASDRHTCPVLYISPYPLTRPFQMYSRLVQRCFDDCVNDFTSKSLQSREESCVMRCVDKNLKASERLGQRFQEQNAAMMQQGGMGAGLGS